MTGREDAQDPDPELETLFALVRARYGARLDAGQLEGVRRGVDALVEAARLLRGVRLDNADEPYQTFHPYRADELPPA